MKPLSQSKSLENKRQFIYNSRKDRNSSNEEHMRNAEYEGDSRHLHSSPVSNSDEEIICYSVSQKSDSVSDAESRSMEAVERNDRSGDTQDIFVKKSNIFDVEAQDYIHFEDAHDFPKSYVSRLQDLKSNEESEQNHTDRSPDSEDDALNLSRSLITSDDRKLSTQERRKVRMSNFVSRIHRQEEKKKENERNIKRSWNTVEPWKSNTRSVRRRIAYTDIGEVDDDLKDFIASDSSIDDNHERNYRMRKMNEVSSLNLADSSDDEVVHLLNDDIMENKEEESSKSDKTPSPISNYALYAQQTLHENLYSPLKQKRRPQYYFSLYIRYLSAASHPSLGESFQQTCEKREKQEYPFFGSAIRSIEDGIRHNMRFISSLWPNSLLDILTQYPRARIINVTDSVNTRCDACRKSHRHDCTIEFYGTKYIPLLRDPIYILEAVHTTTTRQVLHFGSKCKILILFYHMLAQFKFHCVKLIQNEWSKLNFDFEDTKDLTMYVSNQAEEILAPIWDELRNLTSIFCEEHSDYSRVENLRKKIDTIYARTSSYSQQEHSTRRNSKLFHQNIHINTNEVSDNTTFQDSRKDYSDQDPPTKVVNLVSPQPKTNANFKNLKNSTILSSQDSYDFDKLPQVSFLRQSNSKSNEEDSSSTIGKLSTPNLPSFLKTANSAMVFSSSNHSTLSKSSSSSKLANG